MITHYDLFAGIGGFSLALEEVYKDETIRHIFCEWEQFPTNVLRRHWPDGEFYGDIKDLVTHTQQPGLQKRQPENGSQLLGTKREDSPNPNPINKGLEGSGNQRPGYAGQLGGKGSDQTPDWTIVTGGFPCQPFSHAGRRKGTADDRYQWPNMFAVIRNTKPEWVIAENVRGLVTWNEGMVLETVCADLESEGYEVQPFIIPAVAVGAPHRRDRVWIIAHAERNGQSAAEKSRGINAAARQQPSRPNDTLDTQGADSLRSHNGRSQGATDTDSHRLPSIGRTGSGNIHEADAGTAGKDEDSSSRGSGESGIRQEHEPDGNGGITANPKDADRRPGQQLEETAAERAQGNDESGGSYPDWTRAWQEVAFTTCDDSVDDGLQGRLVRLPDGTTITRPKHRKESLKAYGNGIVPQVAIEIMRAIKSDTASFK